MRGSLRHEWVPIASNVEAICRERKRVLDDTGLNMRPSDLVLERCAMCGDLRAMTLRVGRMGDRWRTVAIQVGVSAPWTRSRVVGSCRGIK